jgi:hypothetical protein
MVITWILVYAIAFAVVTALAAKSRGRDPLTWSLVGFFFGVFGLIAVLVMKPDELEDAEWHSRSVATSTDTASTKKCPDCAEEIKLEAKVCRFCGKRFDDAELAATVVPAPQAQTTTIARERKTRDLRCPHCYTLNYDTDLLCAVCGKELPDAE